MAKKLTLSRIAHVELIEVIGRIDGNTLPLVEALDDALASGRHQLILDLSAVEYINSAGLRELVQLLKRVRQKGGELSIANPTERVRTLLELVGLDSVLDIYSDASLGWPHLSNASLFALKRQICYCP
jgi:anti-anti-sigma factor